MRTFVLWPSLLVALALLVGVPTSTEACRSCGKPACVSCCQPSCNQGCQTVERTVLVPTWTTETRTVTATECRPETRERTVTVFKQVPETKTVERTCTVMVPETRTKQVSYCVNVPTTREVTEEYTVRVPRFENVSREYQVRVPVWSEEQREYTVLVPHRETREGTRRVVQCVPVKKTRTVCRDRGHWEEQPADCCGASCGQTACATPCCEADPCGCCESRRSARRAKVASRRALRKSCCEPSKVWVPNIVREEVEVTVLKRECVDQPFTYAVTVCKPETRTRTVKLCSFTCETRTATQRVCHWDNETRTRTRQITECNLETRTKDVNYTVCVPKTETRTEEVTVLKCVPEDKTVQFTVMVPHQVEREVQVRVCKMVPKTIQTQVRTCCR